MGAAEVDKMADAGDSAVKPSRRFSTTLKSGAMKSYGCASGVCAGFRDFILRGNVVDLAVAVVIGSSFTALVNAFVSDWLTPLIAVIFGTADGTFGSLSFTVRTSQFNYGHFVNALISFICVCTILYFVVVLPLNTLMKFLYVPPKKTRECPECCSDIPLKAARCKFCCAAVPPQVALTATSRTLSGEPDLEKGLGKGEGARRPSAAAAAAAAGEEEEGGPHEVWRKAEPAAKPKAEQPKAESSKP